jgi:hypothetical protein
LHMNSFKLNFVWRCFYPTYFFFVK